MSALPPIRREVHVLADPDRAFAVFTRDIGRWWPLAELSVYGAGGSVAFTDGEIVERSRSGEVSVWGAVTAWEPPDRVAFTWHPGHPSERMTHVEVTFTPTAEGTLVRLVHSGWEAFPDPRGARSDYDANWPWVIERFGAAAGGLQRQAEGSDG